MERNNPKTIKELTAELAQERAKNSRLKNLLDRSLSERANLQRALADREENEKKREQRGAELEKEVDNLRMELDVQGYAKKFVAMGMTEKKAEETARMMLSGDMESFNENIKGLIREVEKKETDKAMQKFLENRTEIYAGNGNISVEPSAIKFAKEYAAMQALDTNALDCFK